MIIARNSATQQSQSNQGMKLRNSGGDPSSAFLALIIIILSLFWPSVSPHIRHRYMLQREEAIPISPHYLKAGCYSNSWNTKKVKGLKRYDMQYTLWGLRQLGDQASESSNRPISPFSKKHPSYLVLEKYLLYFRKHFHYRTCVLLRLSNTVE